MGSSVLLRNVANVVNLSTPLGVLVALATGARLRIVDGLLVAERARLRLPAAALTIGSVVVVPRRTLAEAADRIPGLLEHEGNHAWQYTYCLGLPFIPAYFLATGWSWLRSGDRATANHFEVQAGLELGGYRRGRLRSARSGLSDLLGRLRPGDG
ncbi:hypothetical protein GCM10028820_21560 [Tessaracoccus terricola]